MPKIIERRLAFDTETSGVDLRFGSHPFFVSFCNQAGENTWFEWDVDPLTRKVIHDPEDLVEIEWLLTSADLIICHGAKFDFSAIQQTFKGRLNIDWDNVRCTLISAHLCASNHQHDLTSQVLEYLSINIKPYEDRLEKAVKEARTLVETDNFIKRHGIWRIAKKDLPELPSAKEQIWRCDYWLPRAVAKSENYPEEHPWWSVLSEYSNVDTVSTLHLNVRHEELIRKRGLWNIYLERLKLLPIAYDMENSGVTGSIVRLRENLSDYKERTEEYASTCINIAERCGHELVIPKGGRNKSLETFIFDVLKLPITEHTDGGSPSLNKNALESWEATLEANTRESAFVKTLKNKRSVDTAINYLEGYERFATVTGEWFRLHPNLNMTGTDTLRWSSSNPNEQNISKKELFNLRYCFGPGPGREWWSCDAQNIELRLPAFEAGETEMIDLFNRPNDPPYFGSYHLLVFDTLHPEKFAKYGAKCKTVFEDTWYQWVKNGNFAVQYGAQEESGTADAAYHVPGAQAIIQSRFMHIAELNRQQIACANKTGYVETIPDKNVSPDKGYPLLCTRNSYGRIKPTVPLSYHIQGSAMWWMGKAKIRVWSFFNHLNSGGTFAGRKWPGGYFITLQVHDELVSDCPRGSGREPWQYNLPVIEEVQRLMSLGGDDFGIPTPVSRKYHTEGWDVGLSV